MVTTGGPFHIDFIMYQMALHRAYYYLLVLTSLSGLGIVFLNSESILTVCFFVFCFFMMRNSHSMSSSLHEQKQTIRAGLANCMIRGQTIAVGTTKLLCYKKIQLLHSMPHMVSLF